jgi:hypothetical protein
MRMMNDDGFYSVPRTREPRARRNQALIQSPSPAFHRLYWIPNAPVYACPHDHTRAGDQVPRESSVEVILEQSSDLRRVPEFLQEYRYDGPHPGITMARVESEVTSKWMRFVVPVVIFGGSAWIWITLARYSLDSIDAVDIMAMTLGTVPALRTPRDLIRRRHQR